MREQPLIGLPIREFLTRLASDSPTPGGGSVAALTGALAAALGRMVAAFTLGKKKFAKVEPQVRELAARLERAEGMLRALIDEDATAYAVLSEAFKLDRADPRRAETIAQAASLAGSVPLETAALCATVRADLDQLHAFGNPMLQSDTEAALHLALAGQRAAIANVRANLPLMSAEDKRAFELQLSGMG